MVSAEDIKKLREETGLPMSLCREALQESAGDRAKALEILGQRGAHAAEKKSSRSLGAGSIAAYIHNTKTIGTLVELDCETDFVANNDEFKTLAYDLAMHICATAPANLEALMLEPFIKDESRSIKQLIENATQKFGERIELVRFVRYSTKG